MIRDLKGGCKSWDQLWNKAPQAEGTTRAKALPGQGGNSSEVGRAEWSE